MFELSGKCELLFCIDCQRNDIVLTTSNDVKFHYYGKVIENVIEPVECRGPFAYSEPPEFHYEDIEKWQEKHEWNKYFDYHIPMLDKFEETDIEQLAQLSMNDRYYQSLEEILIDNICHGDVSLYEQ